MQMPERFEVGLKLSTQKIKQAWGEKKKPPRKKKTPWKIKILQENKKSSVLDDTVVKMLTWLKLSCSYIGKIGEQGESVCVCVCVCVCVLHVGWWVDVS